jgi:hypothetical protein
MFRLILNVSGAEQHVDWLHVRAEFEALVTSDETRGEEDVMTFDSVISSASDEFETSVRRSGPVRFFALIRVDRDRDRLPCLCFVEKTGPDRIEPVHIGPVAQCDQLATSSTRNWLATSCDRFFVGFTQFYYMGSKLLYRCN